MICLRYRCLDPILTVAACLSLKTPFVAPIDKREEANAAKQRFMVDYSDHLTQLQAFNAWREIRVNRRGYERDFLHSSFLSVNTLTMIAETRKQFFEHLVAVGFVDPLGKAGGGGFGGGSKRGGRNLRNEDLLFALEHFSGELLCVAV